MILKPEDFMIKKAKKELVLKMDETKMDEKVLFKKNSNFHSIKVVNSSIGKFLKYQDTYQAGFIDTEAYSGNLPYINYFLIPYLMKKNIKDILFIGFGTGKIINQYEFLFENLKSVDIVDIEENIFDIAKNYFDFKDSEKYSYNLQDAIIFLRETKKKYDLIVIDVAGDYGVDDRFIQYENLNLIKSHLKKYGILVSNLPSSRDVYNKKNKIILDVIKKYKSLFNNVDLYTGETSNKIFYKTFFNIDKVVLDITNLIFISSDKRYEVSLNYSKIKKLNIDIEKYVDDRII